MGVVEIFKWIYSFEEETKVDLHETASDLKGEVILSKNENGLIFNLWERKSFSTVWNLLENYIYGANSLGLLHISFINKGHILMNKNNKTSIARGSSGWRSSPRRMAAPVLVKLPCGSK